MKVNQYKCKAYSFGSLCNQEYCKVKKKCNKHHKRLIKAVKNHRLLQNKFNEQQKRFDLLIRLWLIIDNDDLNNSEKRERIIKELI